MKRLLFVIPILLLLTGCGITQHVSKHPIQDTFFGNNYGATQFVVDGEAVSSLTDVKFGGYEWDHVFPNFDDQHRFYAISFRSFTKTWSRYNDVKKDLEKKYGKGNPSKSSDFDYSTLFVDKLGYAVGLSVNNGECLLIYFDRLAFHEMQEGYKSEL